MAIQEPLKGHSDESPMNNHDLVDQVGTAGDIFSGKHRIERKRGERPGVPPIDTIKKRCSLCKKRCRNHTPEHKKV